MIDGADAGRKKQPFRRVHGQRGIEDRRARHHQVVAQHFLDLGALVGDAGDRAELAAGNRGRHADLAHDRRIDRRRDALVGPDPVDILDAANIVGEADLHRLGAVGDRAAAHRDDEIGIGGAGLFGSRDHPLPRRMRPHRIESAHATRAERRSDFLDLVGFAVERAADHQKGAASAHAVHLRDHSLRGGSPENHLVHGAENDTALVHACPPGRIGLVMALDNNLAESVGRGTTK